MRLFCAIVLIVGLALPLEAQDERWYFSGSFNGSSNSSGLVTKLDPLLGYNINKNFSTYGGLPFYFVNLKSTTTTPLPTTVSNNGFMTGLGNAFAGLRASVDSEALNFSSNLEVTAPTGDESRGFSTGKMTVDWTNRISRTFSGFTPFGSVGIANTVSDTPFFIRPFTTDGTVGHFDGGASYAFTPAFMLNASAYLVRGSGEQRVISRVVKRAPTPTQPLATRLAAARGRDRVFENQPEIIGPADTVNDHGFSGWIGVTPGSVMDIHAGYSRSVNYDYNTFFFGVGFHIGR